MILLILALVIPASLLHFYDRDFLAPLNYLFYLLNLIAPAAILYRFGFSWIQARVLVLPLLLVPFYILNNFISIPGLAIWWWGITLVGSYLLIAERKKIDWQSILWAEKVFAIVFSLILVINAFHPVLYWGEKPMDLSLLGYFLRLDAGVIVDPWAHVSSLKYYGLGYYAWAMPAKAAGLSLEYAYVYALAGLAGLTAQASFGIFKTLMRARAAFISAVLFPLLSTLGVINSLVKNSFSEIGFFWSATRIFKDNNFAEFPFWSFVFSDLHPHVMAYPIVIIVFAGVIGLSKQWPTKTNLIASGLALSLLPWLNAWDFVLLAPLSFFMLLLYGKSTLKREVILLSAGILIMAIGAYFFTKSPSRHSEFGFVSGSDLLGILMHFGLALSASVALLISRPRKKLALLISILIFLIFMVNHITFIDRTNTVFKFMTSLGLLLSLFIFWPQERKAMRYFQYVIISLSLVASGMLVFNITKVEIFPVKKPSLKSLSFLKYSFPSDAGIIDYLNKLPGTPVVLEAAGKSFDYQLSRISSYTGLPTWLGWDQHVVLRGKTWQEVFARKSFIDQVYQGADVIEIHQMLREQGIDYIVVGPAERARYNSEALMKFDTYPDFFVKVTQHFSSALYYVVTE